MNTIQNKAIIPDKTITRYFLISLAFIFVSLFLFLPVITIFSEALKKGIGLYFLALLDPDTLSAIKLTFLVLVIVLPFNVIFGIMAAWTIAKFDFKGKKWLIIMVDLPFSVSPVVVGLSYVMVFGIQGYLGHWLVSHDIKIIFATPGIILCTIFVTFPFIARELIPLMQSQGLEEEEAAILLGASSWKSFCYITLPNIKWALLYGILLSNARAMGEFGAVSVVSGHIRGQTNTMPLHIEILYHEYNATAAFAVASLLALLSFLTLFLKYLLTSRASAQHGFRV